MKRRKKIDLKSNTKNLLKPINKKIKSNTTLFNKLLDNTKENIFNINDLTDILIPLAKEKEFPQENLSFISSISELKRELSLSKILYEKIFLLDLENNHFAIFTLLDNKGTNILLYKDTKLSKPNNKIIEQYKSVVGEIKEQADINIIDNNINIIESVCGIVSGIISGLKSNDNTREEFVKNFGRSNSNYFSFSKAKKFVEKVTKKAKMAAHKVWIKTLATEIEVLSNNEQFKKLLKDLVNNIPIDISKDFKKYHEALLNISNEEDEEKLTEEDKQSIENLKKKAFDSLKEDGNNKSKINKFNEVSTKLQKHFSRELKNLQKLLEPLTKVKNIAVLEEEIKKITDALELEKKNFIDLVDSSSTLLPNPNGEIELDKIDVNELSASLPTIFSSRQENSKSLEQLLVELKLDSQDKQKIISDYNKISQFYQEWSDKNVSDINSWARNIKANNTSTSTHESIAILDRANELITGGHRLRDTQIISLLTFLNDQDGGQICQIRTGEGKTTIVACLAVIKALNGEQVDIITSNEVLAIEGINAKEQLFGVFDLTVRTNNADSKYISGVRDCYKADIVYGCITNYQFDYLKDYLFGIETRGGRKFQTVILDEVDSMILDNASHIAKLSSPFPGMESLKYVYINIWSQLVKGINECTKNISKEIVNHIDDIIDDPTLAGSDKEIIDFSNNSYGKLLERVKEYIKEKKPIDIRSTNNSENIIPKHIQSYAEKTIDKWIDSAISVYFNYHENEQYKIGKNDEGETVIIPIDNLNTGASLKNTMWQHGVHQFLQLKHNLVITPESLTSCFISNLDYIKLYSNSSHNNILGLTGTLGSDSEQNLLSSIYNVSFQKIPTYREKQFQELEGKIVRDKDFVKNTYDLTHEQLKQGRSVLIVYETIKEINEQKQYLEQLNSSYKIRTFYDEESAEVISEPIGSGEIILASNLAGRGADFKINSQLENNGGLHVICAFLPCNKRVEEQAFGRTSRQGKPGTAEIIVKYKHLENLGINTSSISNITELRTIRDYKEQQRIEDIKEVKLSELEFNKNLFYAFADIYRPINYAVKTHPAKRYILNDIKEYWAFWLESKQFKGKKIKSLDYQEEFNNFRSEVLDLIEIQNQDITKVIKFNPYYAILQAEYYLKQSGGVLGGKEVEKIESALKHAISLSKNPSILGAAYIKLAEVSIEQGYAWVRKLKKGLGTVTTKFIPGLSNLDEIPEYKTQAINYLEKARSYFIQEETIIDQLINSDQFRVIISGKNVNSEDIYSEENYLVKYISSNACAMKSTLGEIDLNIKQLKESSNQDVSVKARVSNYHIDPKNQSSIGKNIIKQTTSETISKSTNVTTFYQIQNNPNNEVVIASKAQIGTGVAILTTGVFVPVAAPYTSIIGNTCISEGIMDLVMEIINPQKEGINRQGYLKGKLISYGMSAVSCGLQAYPGILKKAAKACKWCGDKLKKLGFNKLAEGFYKLEQHFNKIATIMEYNKCTDGAAKLEKLTASEELHKDYIKLGENIMSIDGKVISRTYYEKLKTVGLNIGQTTLLSGKNTLIKVVQNKLVDQFNDSLGDQIKNKIEGGLYNNFYKNLNLKKLPSDNQAVKELISKIRTNDENTFQILFESLQKCISGGIINTISDIWYVKLLSLLSAKSTAWYSIYNFSNEITNKINTLTRNNDASNKNPEQIVKLLSQHFSSIIANKLITESVNTTFDTVRTGWSAYKAYKKDQNQAIKEQKLLQDAKTKIIDKIKQEEELGISCINAFGAKCDYLIEVHQEGKPMQILGNPNSKNIIAIRHIPESKMGNVKGHYVPYGESDDWTPMNGASGKNSCVIDVLAFATGETPNQIKNSMIQELDNNPSQHLNPYSVMHNPVTQGLMKYGGHIGNQLSKIKIIKNNKDKKAYIKQQLKNIENSIDPKILKEIKNNIDSCNDLNSLDKASCIFYILEHLDPKYINDFLCGRFIKISDNGKLYNKLKTLGALTRNCGEQANKIKSLLLEKAKLKEDISNKKVKSVMIYPGDMDTDEWIVEYPVTKEDKQSWRDRIKNINKQLANNTKSHGLQVDNIFKEIRMEIVDGETRLKLESAKYPYKSSISINPELEISGLGMNYTLSKEKHKISEESKLHDDTHQINQIKINSTIKMQDSNVNCELETEFKNEGKLGVKASFTKTKNGVRLDNIELPASYGVINGALGYKYNNQNELVLTGKCGVGVDCKIITISINLIEAELQLKEDCPNLFSRATTRIKESLPLTNSSTGQYGSVKDGKDKPLLLTNKQIHGSMSDDETETQLSGYNTQDNDIGWINSFFSKYSLESISQILSLRVNNLDLNKDISIINCYYNDSNNTDIDKLINETDKLTLVPISLKGRHAVGLIIENDTEQCQIKATYSDSENNSIPIDLKNKIISLYKTIGYTVQFNQQDVETQNYSNCGPELIENFMYYITGDRFEENSAIEMHSQLMESYLLYEDYMN